MRRKTSVALCKDWLAAMGGAVLITDSLKNDHFSWIYILSVLDAWQTNDVNYRSKVWGHLEIFI